MEYSSTFVRYERRGTRVVPVRVTKQWTHTDGLRGKLQAKAFHATRVTELKMRDVRGGREAAPEDWCSQPGRVESRERLLTLRVKKTGEPILIDIGDVHGYLPMGDPSTWSMRQVQSPMDAEPETREWYMRRQWAESRGVEDLDDDAEVS